LPLRPARINLRLRRRRPSDPEETMMKMLGFTAVLATLLATAAPAACAQANTAPGFKAARTPDGKPDLQGVWTNASVTSLQRSAAYTELVIPDEQATRVQQQQYALNQRAQRPTDQSTGAPTDRNTSAGYNRFWVDPGATLGKVKGNADLGERPRHPRRDQPPHGGRQFRRAGDAADGRALPDRLWRNRRAAHAQRAVQQPLPDRADAGSPDDHGRDEP
jgi:hypothetical protein